MYEDLYYLHPSHTTCVHRPSSVPTEEDLTCQVVQQDTHIYQVEFLKFLVNTLDQYASEKKIFYVRVTNY